MNKYLEYSKQNPIIPILIIIAVLIFSCCSCSSLLVIATAGSDPKSEVPSRTEEENEPTEIPPEETRQYTKVISVTDGDTIKLLVDGKEESTRLLSIDAPESNHPTKPVGCYAEEAKQKLTELLTDQYVYIEYDSKQGERDRYDRLLVYIWLKKEGPDQFINEFMVIEGYAKAYRDLPSDYKDEFIELEEKARNDKKGLWGDQCKCDNSVEIERECTACKQATVMFNNWDCSTREDVVTDDSCNALCPVPTATPPVSTPTPTPPSGAYSCNCSKTCPQVSCAEAQYQLNICGCSARDGNNDGVACDAQCE